MNLGGIAGADAICSAEAGSPAKALLTDESGCAGAPCRRASSPQIDWPLQPLTTYYTADYSSVLAATDSSGLLPPELSSAVIVSGCLNEATGMTTDWTTLAGYTCKDWTTDDSLHYGAVGWLCPQAVYTLDLLSGGIMPCSRPLHFLCATEAPTGDFMVYELNDYNPYLSGGPHVVVYESSRAAVVVSDGVQEEFNPDFTDENSYAAMQTVVLNIERILPVYDAMVGTIPPPAYNPQIHGKIPYEIGYIEGSGLASHGVAGAAIGNQSPRLLRGVDAFTVPDCIGPYFINDMYQRALQGESNINHVLFYETMRNYIFPEVFTLVLDYSLTGDPSNWGWVSE
jgi:hypothetical protein